jgi:hypothetical protein
MFRNIRNIRWLIFIVLPLVSCSLSKFGWKGEGESKNKKSGNVAYQEDFDPLTLNDDDLKIVPPAKSDQMGVGQRQMIVVPKTERTEGQMVQGYRIQLIATTDENRAREIKKNAMLKLKEKVYLVFEAPNYKIRVGDCTTRDEAKAIQQDALANGFSDAWIVQSKVYKQTTVETVE